MNQSAVEPSVKGSLVLGAVVMARRHRAQGRIGAEALEARLGSVALKLIDEKIDIGRWYPIQPFCELLDLDWEVGGRRDPQYMREEGERAAERLLQSGIYQQLAYAERVERVRTRGDLVRQAKLIATLTGSLYNFITSEVRLNPGREDHLEICFSNAAAFSEALRYTTEGFLYPIVKRQTTTERWSSRRVRPDLVIFTLALPGRFTNAT